MNHKKQKAGNEFKHLQTKIFIRTAIILFGAIIGIFGLYRFILEGHFANFIVGFFNFFIEDYDTARSLYGQVIRKHMDLYVLFAIVAVFLVVLRIYLRNFTKYFNEINRGIDVLIEERADDIVLSPELAATEKKVNEIKHTLKQRKLTANLAEQRKNDLVVYLAHDLKTPLTSVIGYLTLLRDEPDISPEMRRKYTGISLQKALRLEELINEFFDITRFNLQNITLEKSRFDLSLMIRQIADEFYPAFMGKNIACSLEIDDRLMVEGDPDKLSRVFDNLLKNALSYSAPDTPLFISVHREDDCAVVQVKNHGQDIPAHKLSTIFERFYRLDSARSANTGGAGLGLAIAKEITELHGGKISAESGGGVTTFTVVLPV